MQPFTAGFAAQSVGGALTGRSDARILSVCTDTRAIEPGCLFIGIRGERFDGAEFAPEALRQGAAAVLAEHADPMDGTVILVDSARRALLDLAAAYRAQFTLPVCAVTGSVGKTSTKEMIASVLSDSFETLKNEGNRNNEIGMPLSVFGLEKKHTAAVFEMGMSGFGEIRRMSLVAKPNVGVITNIGRAHIGLLGSQQGILQAKLELLEGLEPGGTLLLNGDDALLRDAATKLPARVRFYGIDSAGCAFSAADLRESPEGTRFTLLENGAPAAQAFAPAPGMHHVYNALAAFAVGRTLGMDAETAAAGIARFRSPGLREKVTDWHGMRLIEDCYNASPDSMQAALGVLAAVSGQGRRVAVLGDMLELGEHAPAAHFEAGRRAAQAGVALLLSIGAEAAGYRDGYVDAGGAQARHFESREALVETLRELLRPGDAVLFKASRGMRLEEIVQALRAGSPPGSISA